MALDPTKNFAKVTVSTGYDDTATSIVLTTGHGAKLPTVSFNAVWWNSTDYGDPADDPNVEVVRVTNIASDTLTVTRAQEGTSATVKNIVGKTYKIIAGLTSKTMDDISDTFVPFVTPDSNTASNSVDVYAGNAISGNNPGGYFYIYGGAGIGSGLGGDVGLVAGQSGATGYGGYASIVGGLALAGGSEAGAASITGGAAQCGIFTGFNADVTAYGGLTDGTGGDVIISGGNGLAVANGGTGIGGNVYIDPGFGSVTSGKLYLLNRLTSVYLSFDTSLIATSEKIFTFPNTSGTFALTASPTFTGTVTIPTPFTLGAISVTSTGTQLNYLNAATGTTGTTSSNLVFSASPTFTGTVGAAAITMTGDLTVDTNVLKVDTTNNRVGIGIATPSGVFTVLTGQLASAALSDYAIVRTSSGTALQGGLILTNSVGITGTERVFKMSSTFNATTSAITSFGFVTTTATETWIGANSLVSFWDNVDAPYITFPLGVQMTTATAIRTHTTAASTFSLSAYDVDGAAYTEFLRLTANNSPTLLLINDMTVVGGKKLVSNTSALNYLDLDASGNTALVGRGTTSVSAGGIMILDVDNDNTGTGYLEVRKSVTTGLLFVELDGAITAGSVAKTGTGSGYFGTMNTSGIVGTAASTFDIVSNTADTSDTKYVRLCGGGAVGNTRGGAIYLVGDDVASVGGKVQISASNRAGASVEIYTGATSLRTQWQSDGNIVFSAPTTAHANVQFTAGTAPSTPVAGDIWHDSTQKTLMFSPYATGRALNYNLFTKTDSTTVANTVTETSVIGTIVGSATMAANSWAIGKSIKLRLCGYLGTTGTPTFQLKVKLGGVTVFDSGAQTMSALISSNELFCIDGEITCRTIGASGTFMTQIRPLYHTGSGATGASILLEGVNTTTATIDTTAATALDITVQWGTANASNTITITNAIVDIAN